LQGDSLDYSSSDSNKSPRFSMGLWPAKKWKELFQKLTTSHQLKDKKKIPPNKINTHADVKPANYFFGILDNSRQRSPQY
jgi:hypothetical protein